MSLISCFSYLLDQKSSTTDVSSLVQIPLINYVPNFPDAGAYFLPVWTHVIKSSDMHYF